MWGSTKVGFGIVVLRVEEAGTIAPTCSKLGINGDDTDLITGLSSAVVLVALGAFLFVLFKPYAIDIASLWDTV